MRAVSGDEQGLDPIGVLLARQRRDGESWIVLTLACSFADGRHDRHQPHAPLAEGRDHAVFSKLL